MKLFVLTFGGPETASTQYRWLQYSDRFKQAGVEFNHAPVGQFKDWNALKSADVVVLQKTLVSGSRLRKIRKHSRRLHYDADDLIWLSPSKSHSLLTRLRISWRLRRIAQTVDGAIAANEVIGHDLGARGAKVAVIPMSLDGSLWSPQEHSTGPVTIGWSGAPKNLTFLQTILPELRQVQARHPEVRWCIHSGEAPKFEGFRYEHIPFRMGEEPSVVRQFDIGLLPLPDEPFSRGKSPIKLLQYFASGVAVVASPVGACATMLEEGKSAWLARAPGDWISHLTKLIQDTVARRDTARAGRIRFEKVFDSKVVCAQLIRHLEGDPFA